MESTSTAVFVSPLVRILIFTALFCAPSTENELYNGIVKDDVCDENSFVPQCDSGKSIFIKSALYGRMDKVCGLYYRKECRYDVFPALDENCRNASTCSVKSGTEAFGNPCRFYEASYLEVQYWCIHKDLFPYIHTSRVCTGQDFSADCGESHVMQILSARYGDDVSHSVTACGVDIFNDINNCSSQQTCRKSVASHQFYSRCEGGSTCAVVRYMCIPKSRFSVMTTPAYSTEAMPDYVTWQSAAKLRTTTMNPTSSKDPASTKKGFNELELVVYTVVGVITLLIVIIIFITCYNFYRQRKPGVKAGVYVYSEVARRPIEMTDMSKSANTASVACTEHALTEANSVRHRSCERVDQSEAVEPTAAPLLEDACTLPEGSVV